MSQTALTITVLVGAAAVAAIPPARQKLWRLLDRLRRPTPRHRALTALIVFIIAGGFLLFTAWEQQREFIPKFHDEFMHLLQMRMLAHGMLWTQPHPLADFFESFHVLVRPVYASIYFPGTALLYLPTIWLGLPSWVMPLLAAAASAALLYRVVTELIDGVAGLLAAGMLVALSNFRLLSLVVMSHGAIILFGLVILWAFLNWRRTRSLAWAAMLGAAMGWAAITRPVDAISMALPVGVALLLQLRIERSSRRWTTLATVIVCALPLVALQLVQNVGVTGRPLQTPYQLYARNDSPGLEFGFASKAPPASSIQSELPQKRLFYEQFLRPEIEDHRLANVPGTLVRERLPLLARTTLPNAPWLLILWPALFVARGMWKSAAVLWAMLPIYLLLYAAFPFLLPHYAVVPAPAVLCGVLLAKRGIEQRVPQRFARATEVFLTVTFAGLALAAVPGIDRQTLDDGRPRPSMWFAEKLMPQAVTEPAIVLFRFTPGDNFHEEPVYNVETVNPDDAPIIRAHDLGPARNRELFDYYARTQPQRNVYLFDRRSRSLTRAGRAR
jgi:4-amino-4-deoxy-L-arabinose transferase-like glycosyltransferase